MLAQCSAALIVCLVSVNVLHFVFRRPSAPAAIADQHKEEPPLPDGDGTWRKIVLDRWLRQNGWHDLVAAAETAGIRSLALLAAADPIVFEGQLRDDLKQAQDYLPPSAGLPALERVLLEQLYNGDVHGAREGKTHRKTGSMGSLSSKLVTAAAAAAVIYVLRELGLTPQEMLWTGPLHKSFTRLDWPRDKRAEHTKYLAVSFYTVTGQPKDVSDFLSALVADVWHQSQRVNAFVTQGEEPHVAHVVFTARLAGRYYAYLKFEGNLVRGFPAPFNVEAGEPDAASTSLSEARSSTLVLSSGVPDTVLVQARDKFGNLLPKERLADLTSRFTMTLLARLGDTRPPDDEDASAFVVYVVQDHLYASMGFAIGSEGWYKAAVELDGQPVGEGELTLIVLSHQERAKVGKYLDAGVDSSPAFDAEIVAENGNYLAKPRTVFVQLTSRQLTLKDYFLKFIPRKLFSFRVVPGTKVTLTGYAGEDMSPVLQIADGAGYQSRPRVKLREGNVLAALFYLALLKKLGGSESFKDKEAYFYAKLLKHHQQKGHKHTRLPLLINRHDLLNSTLKATRWFAESDWMRLFEVRFEGEPGIDHGGLRREFLEILAKKLFHPSEGLFVSVEENSGAVYPNPDHQAGGARPKLYRLAGKIAGKCLYESAHGSAYKQFLPARLATSFLAQLVGLRPHYRHFANDAPDLYSSKIAFILDNNVDSLDLTFTDDEYGRNGELLRTVELKPGGVALAVVESNKLEYLNLLAQRRLGDRVREQIDQFLLGFQQFVPDALLSLFDESELEVLLCGMREFNLSDMKANTNILFPGGPQLRTLDWFWLALSSFEPEQMAKLVQFVTGSAQLPPGGFADLRPKLQIGGAEGRLLRGGLPTAHTCFNHLCLPEHDTFESFQKSLLLAINEGSEGFGFA